MPTGRLSTAIGAELIAGRLAIQQAMGSRLPNTPISAASTGESANDNYWHPAGTARSSSPLFMVRLSRSIASPGAGESSPLAWMGGVAVKWGWESGRVNRGSGTLGGRCTGCDRGGIWFGFQVR